MREHLQGMHTGIGATSEGKGDGLTKNRGERLFEGLLHRDTIRLRLRAVERGSVICESDEVTHLVQAISFAYTLSMLLGAAG